MPPIQAGRRKRTRIPPRPIINRRGIWEYCSLNRSRTRSEFNMKLRSFFYVLVAGATGLLLIAVAGFFWITSQSPLNWLQHGAMANPTAAIFVPKQAPAMVSLLVNPNRLEAFRQLVAPPFEPNRKQPPGRHGH
jgi:hypothetical protein